MKYVIMGSQKVYVKSKADGSAKSCATRNLSNFPMTYSQQDVRASVKDIKSARCVSSEYVEFSKRLSSNQQTYSKHLFEETLSTCNRRGSSGSNVEIIELSIPVTPRKSWLRKSSGPTENGSIIFGRKPELLNRSKVIQQNCPHGYLIPHRHVIPQTLREHMRSFNKLYRVVAQPGSPMSSGESNNSSNFSSEHVLVPLSEYHEEGARSPALHVESYKEVEREMTKMSNYQDLDQEEEGDDPAPRINPVVIPIIQVDGNVVDQQAASPEHLDPLDRLKVGDRIRPRSSPSISKNTKGRSTSPHHRPKSSHSRPGRSRKSTCWVDDATVSSIESTSKALLSAEPGNTLLVPGSARKKRSRAGSRAGSRAASRAGSKKGSVKSGKSVKSSKSVGKAADKGEKEKTQAPVSVVVDSKGGQETEPEAKLPGFICPSSEDKSRQAAVREWMTRLNFPTSIKSVPLL